ncbi:MAG: hypothetical protein WCT49_06810 [Candidatus Paceibacterota bacterium]|jgi:hypothetical protein|nr:hypothetical protein [Candidatus Paceibacterota bacterium]
MKTKIFTFIGVFAVFWAATFWLLQRPANDETPEAPKQTENNKTLSETEARTIAAETCVKGGSDSLKGSAGIYNEVTKTWWFDANLNSTKPGCNPACVVSEQTKKAEINWRCTGAIPPPSSSTPPPQVSQEISCPPKTGNEENMACIALYKPVCAKVAVQCIKAPCPPVDQTFGNSCEACNNPLVSSYKEGECVKR